MCVPSNVGRERWKTVALVFWSAASSSRGQERRQQQQQQQVDFGQQRQRRQQCSAENKYRGQRHFQLLQQQDEQQLLQEAHDWWRLKQQRERRQPRSNAAALFTLPGDTAVASAAEADLNMRVHRRLDNALNVDLSVFTRERMNSSSATDAPPEPGSRALNLLQQYSRYGEERNASRNKTALVSPAGTTVSLAAFASAVPYTAVVGCPLLAAVPPSLDDSSNYTSSRRRPEVYDSSLVCENEKQAILRCQQEERFSLLRPLPWALQGTTPHIVSRTSGLPGMSSPAAVKAAVRTASGRNQLVSNTDRRTRW